MAKKLASLYFNNEIAGNGGTRYVKGTQPGKHSPVSQENVHLTKSYKQFIPQLMGSVATVIDPNSAQASQPWLYNTIPRFTQVNVIRGDKGNITTDFNIQKENTITNGVYSVAFRNENKQMPTSMGVSDGWVPQENEKWKYYRNGSFATAEWVQIGEKWYYIGADQYMVTGLHIIDGKQYYFKKKEEDLENKNNYGQMIAHKWWKINDIWYYFHSDGSMLFSGWRMDAAGTDWYYCGADGKMVEDQVIPWKDGKLYYVGHGGAMVKNAKVTDPDTGKTYEADGNGVLVPSVNKIHAIAGTDKQRLSQTQQEENAYYMAEYLNLRDWSLNAIAGAFGNIEVESHFNPGVWQKQDNLKLGYGLVQWDDGQRFLDYTGMSSANDLNTLVNTDPQKLMDMELEFLIDDCSRTTSPSWIPTMNYLAPCKMKFEDYKKSTKSAYDLALVFHSHYERSSDSNSMINTRG